MAQSRQGRQQRELDTVVIENPEVGVFDVFNALTITTDLLRPSEASFEVGNDSVYNSLVEEAVRMGAPFRVSVNERVHLTGRVELLTAPLSADSGVPLQFVVRTKLADAMYASASPDIRVSKGTTIKDFILALYEPLGLTEADFVFSTDVSRDILTGKSSNGTDSPVPIDDIKEEQLKVNPPETIYAAADRVLRRHGLMHWDAPDGRIVVGAPNDTQPPIYDFRAYNDDRARLNNILTARRSRDFSQAPALLGVYGTGGKKNWKKSKVGNVQTQPEVYDITDRDGTRSFYRPVLIINEGVKTDELAERHARRELTQRSQSIDTWEIEVDGLSYWNGSERIPYGHDTVANIDTSLVGGPAGAYLVTRVVKKRNISDGDMSAITLLKKGLFAL